MTLPLVYGIAAVFFGGLLQGVAGFGVGLLSVPVLLRVFPPASVAVIATGFGVLLNIQIFMKLRRDADVRIILPFLLGASCGIWPGSFIPRFVPPQILNPAVGVLVCFAGVSVWRGWKCSLSSPLLRFLVGVSSGLLGGSVSLSSPPIAIFLTAGSVPKNVFRASTACYFLSLNVITLSMFGLQGRLDGVFWNAMVWLAPAVAAGTMAGILIAGRVREELFRRFVIVTVILSGLSLMV